MTERDRAIFHHLGCTHATLCARRCRFAVGIPPTLTPLVMPTAPLSQMPADWPGRERSRCVSCDGIEWHVERAGEGPTILLVHGTGCSTHSWTPVIDGLIHKHDVIAIDLPGHGFTVVPPALTNRQNIFAIDGMARAVGALLRHLGVAPEIAVGHSAGVPVLMQMALDGSIAPRCVIGCNPALVAPPAFYTTVIAPLVGAFVERETVADTGAWLARGTGLVELMLRSSGSPMTAPQLARYRWLCQRPAHVHAALTMMSRWDLPRLMRDAQALRVPLDLIGGTRDRWVPPDPLARAVERLLTATLRFESAGHLLPEEQPQTVIDAIAAQAHSSTTAR